MCSKTFWPQYRSSIHCSEWGCASKFQRPLHIFPLKYNAPSQLSNFHFRLRWIIKHFLLLFLNLPCKQLLRHLKLLGGYWRSLSLIFVMWFINNESGIKDHHLVYRQSPPKEPGRTLWIWLDVCSLNKAFQKSWCGDGRSTLFNILPKAANCTAS